MMPATSFDCVIGQLVPLLPEIYSCEPAAQYNISPLTEELPGNGKNFCVLRINRKKKGIYKVN